MAKIALFRILMYKITRNIFGKKTSLLLALLALMAVLTTIYVVWQWVAKPTVNTSGKEVVFYVKTNQSFQEVYQNLLNQQLLTHPQGFKQLASWLKLPTKMKPGRYVIDKPLSNLELINMLIKGRQQPFNIVFNYAERNEDLAAFFSKKLEADSAEIVNLLYDTAYLALYGLNSHTAISMFIPNTYNFYWNTSAKALVERMASEYKKYWTDARKAKAAEMGFTPAEIATIASIVQKETNKNDEMPVVAGVYINRLRKNMPLQADPTVLYAINDKSIKRVTGKHLAYISPYNTYINIGLPPGPICTPSQQAIDAVLNYKQHKYYYFCAKDDLSGYHAFATTLDSHIKNAVRYQRALNKLGIK